MGIEITNEPCTRDGAVANGLYEIPCLVCDGTGEVPDIHAELVIEGPDPMTTHTCGECEFRGTDECPITLYEGYTPRETRPECSPRKRWREAHAEGLEKAAVLARGFCGKCMGAQELVARIRALKRGE